MPSIRFRWRRSVDVVEDSLITYVLVLQFNDQEHRYENIADTSTRVSRVDFNRNDTTLVTWWVLSFDQEGYVQSRETFTLSVAPLSVEDEEALLPEELALRPAYPNPFNDQVTIRYDLPAPGEVILTIHDPMGRLVQRLENRSMTPGRYKTVWDGRDVSGHKVSSGLYLCRIVTPYGVRLQRIVLVK